MCSFWKVARRTRNCSTHGFHSIQREAPSRGTHMNKKNPVFFSFPHPSVSFARFPWQLSPTSPPLPNLTQIRSPSSYSPTNRWGNRWRTPGRSYRRKHDHGDVHAVDLAVRGDRERLVAGAGGVERQPAHPCQQRELDGRLVDQRVLEATAAAGDMSSVVNVSCTAASSPARSCPSTRQPRMPRWYDSWTNFL